jgi:hypothetical protein
VAVAGVRVGTTASRHGTKRPNRESPMCEQQAVPPPLALAEVLDDHAHAGGGDRRLVQRFSSAGPVVL